MIAQSAKKHTASPILNQHIPRKRLQASSCLCHTSLASVSVKMADIKFDLLNCTKLLHSEDYKYQETTEPNSSDKIMIMIMNLYSALFHMNMFKGALHLYWLRSDVSM